MQNHIDYNDCFAVLRFIKNDFKYRLLNFEKFECVYTFLTFSHPKISDQFNKLHENQ